MLRRPRRSLEVLSISALDIFASSLGVFILVALLLFPYYLKQPSVEIELAGAEAALSQTRAALIEARQAQAQSIDDKGGAKNLLAELRQELATIEEERQAAEDAARAANEGAEIAAERKAGLEKAMATLMIAHLDLVFVMDATGSMRDEIEDVSQNLLGIIRILRRFTESLHVGFVAFKDVSDDYVTRSFDLHSMEKDYDLREIRDFVTRLRPSGGGDPPEPVERALREAVDMPWRENAEGRIIVVGDAPARSGKWKDAFALANAFQGIKSTAGETDGLSRGLRRQVGAIFTGRNERGRQFYERLAEAGGGEYVAHRGRIMESILLSLLRTSPDQALSKVK